jgi:hypothetical protein
MLLDCAQYGRIEGVLKNHISTEKMRHEVNGMQTWVGLFQFFQLPQPSPYVWGQLGWRMGTG